LWEAVETNDLTLAEEMLEKVASEQHQLSDNDLFDAMGNSMAHKAASLGHAEMLMLLLERTGAKPDIINA
jgi:ankyrin repeat protein